MLSPEAACSVAGEVFRIDSRTSDFRDMIAAMVREERRGG